VILAGDIGGTKTHLGLFDSAARGAPPVRERQFKSADHASLTDIVREFMAGAPAVEAAAFGVAGPVIDGHVKATNLPWLVDARSLGECLEHAPVTLLNDLEAMGLGVDMLDASDLAMLNAGHPRPGPRAVIAAGTGLGEAFLYWDGRQHHAVATEGGHSDFAPRNDLEIELLRYLSREFGHVSWERVLSGPGLFNCYRFLRDSGRGPEPPPLAERLRAEDPPRVIAEEAFAGRSPLCTAALDLFCSLYGAETGNLALKTLAVNGVYVGGGNALRLLTWLAKGGFLQAFLDKGRMRPMLEQIPVFVILRPETALLGAARAAFHAVHQEIA
jgi:glucokinase